MRTSSVTKVSNLGIFYRSTSSSFLSIF